MKTILTKFLFIFILFLALVGITHPVIAQSTPEPVYRLNLSRDFGYGAGADIKGLFSMRVVGPQGVMSVTFFIDGQPMSTVTEDPFKFQFNTSQYAIGWHDLTAEVTDTAGQVFLTPARHMNFVSSEMESEGMKTIVLPMLAVIFGVILVVFLIQFVFMGKRKQQFVEAGMQRNYGFAGGSICRHCGRPTPRHMWGFNVVIGKLDRCENCGRWSIMQALPIDVLRTAEAAEKASLKEGAYASEKSEEDQLRDLIDRSKYD